MSSLYKWRFEQDHCSLEMPYGDKNFCQHWIWYGLLPNQAITWTNADLLSIRHSGTNFSDIWPKIQKFSMREMHLKKMLSTKSQQFCSCLNVSIFSTIMHNIVVCFDRNPPRCDSTEADDKSSRGLVVGWLKSVSIWECIGPRNWWSVCLQMAYHLMVPGH